MRLFFSFLLSFVGSTIISFAQKETTYKTYRDSKNGLSIQYPANWESRTVPNVVFFLSRPREEQGQRFTENVNLIIDPPDDLTLDEYGSVAIDRLQKQIDGFHELKHEKLKLGGREYYRLFYTFDYKGLKMHDVYYVTVYKDCSYSFSCSALENTYTRFFPVFEKMIASFRVK
jgi:hypothetical protein